MAGTLNKVMLIGNLGKDPEIMHFENGGSLVKFPVATSETYTNKEGQKVSNTDWHSVVINAKGLVDVAHKYLKKGHKVYLEGRIKTRKWQDQTGADRYTTEIQATQMTMLTSRADGDLNSGYGNENQLQSPVSTPMPSVPNNSGKQEGDDLPF
jgi:single-strand DNA-binding protein